MKRDKIKKLRELLNKPEMVVAPGVYDCVTAKYSEAMGFGAVYVTGAGVSVSRVGVPDIGLVTMSEILDTARNIANTVDVPVICDTDTGYGNSINVIRTVREFGQNSGVAAIQLEDQITPKKCGHIEGKQILSQEEMIKKIEAFKYALDDEDLILIARTDAIAVEGIDEALTRAKAYAQAGADVLFVEAPRSVEEMKRINETLSDYNLLVNMVEGGGKTPILPTNELEAMGYSMAIYPISMICSAMKAIKDVLRELKEKGSTEDHLKNMVSFQEMFEVVGLSDYRNLEKKFLTF